VKLQRLFSSSSVTTTNNAGCFPGVDSTPLLLDNLYKVFNHVIVCRTDAVNQKKLFAYVNSSTYPFFCACQNVVIWKRSVHFIPWFYTLLRHLILYCKRFFCARVNWTKQILADPTRNRNNCSIVIK